jgi:hypothetical protein
VLNKLNYSQAEFISKTIPGLNLLSKTDLSDWRVKSEKNIARISQEFRFLALYEPNDFSRLRTDDMRNLKKSFDVASSGLKNLETVWTARRHLLFSFFKKFKVMDHNLQLLNFEDDKEKLLKSEMHSL